MRSTWSFPVFCFIIFQTLLQSACHEISIHNGKLPAELQAQSRQLDGVYRGSFAGQNSQIQIQTLQGKPQISFEYAEGNHPFGRACEFAVGDLSQLHLEKVENIENENPSQKISSTFQFEAKNCDIPLAAHELTVQAEKVDSHIELTLQLLEKEETQRVCDWTSSPEQLLPQPPCRWIPQPVYFAGHYSKDL